MKAAFSWWCVICLCAGLSLWGCGSDGDGDGGSGGAGGTANNNSGNGNSGNNNSGGASCASVCAVLAACPGALDSASCMILCDQMMSASCRDCMANSSECGNDCTAACSDSGGGGDMNNGGGGGGMNNGGGSQQAGDLGQGCRFSSDCSTEVCIGGGIQDGYCSQACTDFTDCPDFWECSGNPDGPGQVCLNNG